MIFVKLGTLFAWAAIVLGVGVILNAQYFAFKAYSQFETAEAAKTFLSQTSLSDRTMEGILSIVAGVVIGLLVRISKQLESK